jgi:hypothetical protein
VINYGTPELRERFKAYSAECHLHDQKWWQHGIATEQPKISPPYPDECRDMRCAARTRSGSPCKNNGTTYSNGRCKFHGGLSSGPKSKSGKLKSAANGHVKKMKRIANTGHHVPSKAKSMKGW